MTKVYMLLYTQSGGQGLRHTAHPTSAGLTLSEGSRLWRITDWYWVWRRRSKTVRRTVGELSLHGEGPDIWTLVLNIRRQRTQMSARGMRIWSGVGAYGGLYIEL